MPGLCLLDIGGAPYIGYNIRPPKALLTFLTSSLKLPIVGTSYYVRIMPDSRPSSFVKIILKFYPQTFWRNFENVQNTKILVLVTRTLKIFSSKTAEQNS